MITRRYIQTNFIVTTGRYIQVNFNVTTLRYIPGQLQRDYTALHPRSTST
jgi:hypothetical protein